MPTIIGTIFFCIGTYFFFYKQDGLLGLLIIASAFEASSALNIVERGIQPYYLIAGFVIARALLNRALGAPSASMPYGRWLMLFGFISVASAFILPFVYEGLPVYEPKVGIDAGLIIHPPLRFGLNNAAQAGFLACHLATAYAVLSLKSSSAFVRKAFLWSLYIVVAFIFLESVFQLLGVPFPYSIILNNPGYGLWDNDAVTSGTRNPGTFSEPSLVGGFLVFYAIGFVAEYVSGRGSAFRVLLSLLGIGAVAASGSLFILVAFCAGLLVLHLPVRFPWYFSMRQAKRIGWVLFLLMSPLLVVLASSAAYRETLFSLTVDKGNSGSFFNRTASDLYALQLLVTTHGIGVGLGSNRSSSMFCTLISNVGVAGLLAFTVFYILLFAKLPKDKSWFKWAAFALLANMFLDIADVTFPVLWIPIFMAIHFNINPRESEEVWSRPASGDTGRAWRWMMGGSAVVSGVS